MDEVLWQIIKKIKQAQPFHWSCIFFYYYYCNKLAQPSNWNSSFYCRVRSTNNCLFLLTAIPWVRFCDPQVEKHWYRLIFHKKWTVFVPFIYFYTLVISNLMKMLHVKNHVWKIFYEAFFVFFHYQVYTKPLNYCRCLVKLIIVIPTQFFKNKQADRKHSN